MVLIQKPRHLHGNRRGSGSGTALQQIIHQRAAHRDGIDAEVVIEIPVFLVDNGFLQGGCYFPDFYLHSPFIVVTEESIQNFSLAICDQQGIRRRRG